MEEIILDNLKNQKGQSLVEFSIVLPLLLLIIMGIAEFGVMLNSYLAVQNAAREGARLAIVGGADADIKSLIISISPGLAADDIAVSIIPSEGSRISGNMLTVNVTYNYHVTVPIINNLLNNAIQLKAQTSMRIE